MDFCGLPMGGVTVAFAWPACHGDSPKMAQATDPVLHCQEPWERENRALCSLLTVLSKCIRTSLHRAGERVDTVSAFEDSSYALGPRT